MRFQKGDKLCHKEDPTLVVRVLIVHNRGYTIGYDDEPGVNVYGDFDQIEEHWELDGNGVEIMVMLL